MAHASNRAANPRVQPIMRNVNFHSEIAYHGKTTSRRC